MLIVEPDTPCEVAPPLLPEKATHGGEYGSPGTWSDFPGHGAVAPAPAEATVPGRAAVAEAWPAVPAVPATAPAPAAPAAAPVVAPAAPVLAPAPPLPTPALATF